MKNLAMLFCILSLAACQLSPCGINKTSFLAKHEYLADQAKENRKKWKAKQWEESDAQMKKFLEECYESYEAELTDAEASRFWTKTASYYIQRFGKSFVSALKNTESDVSIALEKGLRSIKKDPNEFLREILRDSGGEELKDALDELGEGLKEIGTELEKWLNE